MAIRTELPPAMKTAFLKKGGLPSHVGETREDICSMYTWQDMEKVNVISAVGDSGTTSSQVRLGVKMGSERFTCHI